MWLNAPASDEHWLSVLHFTVEKFFAGIFSYLLSQVETFSENKKSQK